MSNPKGNFNSAYCPSIPEEKEGGIDSFKGEYKKDLINHPSHYTNGDIECIDAIESAVSTNPNPSEIPCQANILKYIWRYYSKDQPLKDLQKCRWYLNRLITMQIQKENK